MRFGDAEERISNPEAKTQCCEPVREERKQERADLEIVKVLRLYS